MSIKARIITILSVLFALMLCIIAYASVINMIQAASIKDALVEGKIYRIRYLLQKDRGQITLALQHHPQFEFASLHNHPTEFHLKQVEEGVGEVERLWTEYYADINDPQEKQLADAFYANTEELAKKSLLATVSALRKGEWNTAEHLLLGQVAKNYSAALAGANELSAHILARLQAETARAKTQARIAQIVVIIVALAVSIFSAISLLGNIIPPLNRAVEIAEQIGKGDLTQAVTVNSKNEIGRMLTAISDMKDNLINMVSSVMKDSDTIASATSEIAAGNMDLSSRTEQQAASLEETASSVDEMTQTIHTNTEKVTQANTLVSDVSKIATEAGAVVSDVVSTMDVINQSSHRIVDIISVIDGIAFQTNILALNAAVEAARAGEQGRGFAVVATEVRSLAQRSATAAREIKELIDDSVEKVQQGSTLVNRTGEIMDRVVNSIHDVTVLMNEITIASQEQASGIQQINTAVSQMDQATQQNAALVEETAAAAQALSENAARLKETVGVFRLPGISRSMAPQALPFER
ncbi:MAG: methyl-accepting chemotaxis protein [Alistipes senegalensis]|nr:methyl-accepting chemotaxis protein [Oxalobacter formigenes]MCM1281934.1 methyl-accepting chemotaxis protein [Alistipes senegalensis]